ncbi:hypothetical protein ACE6H2_016168 [Prunus campanulata]
MNMYVGDYIKENIRVLVGLIMLHESPGLVIVWEATDSTPAATVSLPNGGGGYWQQLPLSHLLPCPDISMARLGWRDVGWPWCISAYGLTAWATSSWLGL